MGTRLVKLLRILIKIGIMMLVMTGLILINKYISNANGREKEGRKTSLERAVKPCFIIYNQEENLPPYPLLNFIQKK
jgi:hypothetical protein